MLTDLIGQKVYAASLEPTGEGVFFLARDGQRKRLVILSNKGIPHFEGTSHTLSLDGRTLIFQSCPLTAINARAAPSHYLDSTPPARTTGFGRLWRSAGNGHSRPCASRAEIPADPHLCPAIDPRNDTTGRTPQQVLDEAMWGVFQEGWRQGYGADADHLKTPEEADRCVEAGFTFFTINPSAFVDNGADTADAATLEAQIAALPWETLETTLSDLRRAYLDQRFPVGPYELSFEERTLMQALAKYGGAIAHTTRMARHLAERMDGQPFELEMSVDETEVPPPPLNTSS